MTRKDWLQTIFYTLLSVVLFGATFGAGYYFRGTQYRTLSDRYPLLAEVQAILDDRYLGETLDDTALNRALVRGLLEAYEDPYTFYVEPVQAQLNSDNLAGVYGGIGSYLSRNAAGDLVLDPFPNSPAEQAGILTDDVLLEVDDTPITPELSIDDIVSIVRGPVGTVVTLLIRTGDDAPREVEVTRAQIDLPSVDWRLLEQDPTIGYIRLTRFSDRSAEEITTAIQDLRDDGATRLVLDLRNNGGGLLDSAVEVADVFLGAGVVMYEEILGQPEKTFRAENGEIGEDLPLVVLVNGNSASASEILAGALQDRDRAPLIGQTTFGKGSVQLIFPLSDGGSLHVTNARWFTPNRTNLSAGGLTPDIMIEFDADAHGQGFDPELTRAIEVLNEQ